MRRTLLMGLMIALLGCGLVSSQAEAKTIIDDFLGDKGIDLEVSASVYIYDKYIWRGFKLDGDTVIQPAITLSLAGFEGGLWSSFDMESDDGFASDEVDGWIGYNFDLGFINEDLSIVGLSIGNTWYYFPEAGTYSKELYLGVSLDVFLSPYFTWYFDYGDEDNGGADGSVYAFGASHSITLNEDYGITLDLAQEVGINDGAFIVGDGGYSLTTVGFTIPLSETLTMAPVMGYSVPFGDLSDDDDGNQKEQFYGGVSLAYSF